ncbi:hypothetical protein AYI68_g2346 [Smittium mucronatum]|uniref:Uncharacterized protein n=1 Tax=Smittium mucronatum TaxID=133383 RepID=A0A1R0H2Y5_9FUNG|nr:hypothetical protein AYI68_g2346 [Smittium mucronatum]
MNSFTFLLVLVVVLCVVQAAAQNDVLIWKEDVTDPVLIKRYESVDYTNVPLNKRTVFSSLDATTQKFSTMISNLLWTVIANL